MERRRLTAAVLARRRLAEVARDAEIAAVRAADLDRGGGSHRAARPVPYRAGDETDRRAGGPLCRLMGGA